MIRKSISDIINVSAVKVKVLLSDKSTPIQAMSAVDGVCAALQRSEQSVERLRVLLGRVMAEVQDRKLFEPAYESFEQFTQAVAEKHRLSRTTIRESLLIARRLPGLTPEQAENIPLTNLTLAARMAKDQKPRAIGGILKNAANMNVLEFRQKAMETLHVDGNGAKGDKDTHTRAKTVLLRLRVSEKVAKLWAGVVGTQDAGEVFAGMVMGMVTEKKKAA